LADLPLRHDDVLDLQRLDRLFEVRRRSLDLHDVPDRERTVRQPDRGDADLAVEVEDLADFLAFHDDRRRMRETR